MGVGIVRPPNDAERRKEEKEEWRADTLVPPTEEKLPLREESAEPWTGKGGCDGEGELEVGGWRGKKGSGVVLMRRPWIWGSAVSSLSLAAAAVAGAWISASASSSSAASEMP